VAQGPGQPAEQGEVTGSLLAAVVIVANEAGPLPACLQSLAGVVDEIRVHDTGSVDGTVEVAAGMGATVTRGAWSDDFAAARNEAAAGVPASWILAVDADHRVRADAGALRAYLADAPADALLARVDDAHHSHPYSQLETRLYRPGAVSWTGRVHERLILPDGSAPRRETVPEAVLSVRHVGYATHEDRIRRAVRNVALSRMSLDEMAARGDPAQALLDLGRDLAAAEYWQQATDAFEALRELFPGSPEWSQGTDCLARITLAAGLDEVCLVLVEQLRAAGAPRDYCDWLAAQATAQLGDPHHAGELLAGITEVVDTAGRRHDPAALRELTSLVERLQTLTPHRA
jgi:hypothetical protein